MTNYLLRNIDTTTWTKFGERCGGVPMRLVLLRLIKAFASGRLTLSELPNA